jgi:hypothetical protein
VGAEGAPDDSTSAQLVPPKPNETFIA